MKSVGAFLRFLFIIFLLYIISRRRKMKEELQGVNE